MALIVKVTFRSTPDQSEIIEVSDERVVECLKEYFQAISVEILEYKPSPDEVPPEEESM